MPKGIILNCENAAINWKRNNSHQNLITSPKKIADTHDRNEIVCLSGHILYFEPNKKFTFVCNACKTKSFKRLKEFFKHFKKCYTNEITLQNAKIVNELNLPITTHVNNVLEPISDENVHTEAVDLPCLQNNLLNGTHNSDNIDGKLYSAVELHEPNYIKNDEGDEIVTNFYFDGSDVSNDIVFYNELSSPDNHNNSSQTPEKNDVNNAEINLENENASFINIKKRKLLSESNLDCLRIIDNTENDTEISIVNNNNCENGIKSHLYMSFINDLEIKTESADIFESVDDKWKVALEDEESMNKDDTKNNSNLDQLKCELLNNINEENDIDSNDTMNGIEPNIIDNCEIIVEQEDSEFDDLPNFNIICEKCKGQFGTIEELKNHRKILNSSNPNAYECDLSLISKNNDNTTLLNLITEKSSYNCLYCNKSYLKKVHLIEHEQNAHIKDTPYECIYCNKKFVTSTARANHENLHVTKKI